MDSFQYRLSSLEKQNALKKFLARFPHEIPVDVIVPLLEDPDQRVRNNAARSLVRARYPEIFSYLVQMTYDTDIATRNLAVGLLRDLRNNAAILPLLDRLNDPDPLVRSRTAVTLVVFGEVGDQLAIKRLAKLSRTERALVMRAYANLARGGEAVLAYGLKDDDAWIRTEAVKALSNRKTDEATTLLLSALKDPFPTIRLEAVRGLKGRSDSRIKDAINPLNDDPDLDVACAVSSLFYL